MKIKVGELFGKPVVWGNSNEFESHEISLEKLLNGEIELKDIKD